MQGVRTRRGCLSCRRRKKGCDFKRPKCGRCQRLNVQCSYEERNYTFVTETGSPPDRNSPPKELTTASMHSASQSSLKATDVNLQVDAEFWRIYLPNEDPLLDGSIDGVLAAPWIPTVRALAQEDGNVRIAINAIAYAGLGWMKENSSLIQHSLRLYAQALRETNTLLQDPMTVQTDAALACCRVLSLFEMFQRSQHASTPGQSQSNDWRSHVEGTCRLVQLRGYQKHTYGHGRSLYDGVRMTAIIQGLARAQPNAFTTLPWDLPGDKTLRDDLFDSMSTVPDLLQRVSNLRAQCSVTDDAESKGQLLIVGIGLLNELLELSQYLQDWEIRTLDICEQARSRHPESRDIASMEQQATELQLLDVSSSHGFGFFFLCTQFWAVCVRVHGTARLLRRQLQVMVEDLHVVIAVQPLPTWIDPEPPAHHIANTAFHYFEPAAGLWAAQSAIFPIGTALFYFVQSGRKDSPAFKKMMGAFSDNKPGAIMRDFLQSTIGARAGG